MAERRAISAKSETSVTCKPCPYQSRFCASLARLASIIHLLIDTSPTEI
jgi:hypothetical protein